MLIPCRNCGNDVGEKAEISLGCGTKTPNPERKFRSNFFVIYFFITLLTIFCFEDVFLTGHPIGALLGLIYLIALLGSGLWFYLKDTFK